MMGSAERLCDSVCIIAGGEKLIDGPVAKVREEHGGRRVALELADGRMNGVAAVLADRTLVSKVDDANRIFDIELAPGADPQLLLRRLVESGANIARFELAQASLHRIFVERVGAASSAEEENGNA
jgi:ABC-2 type transport system ATP-binding protein